MKALTWIARILAFLIIIQFGAFAATTGLNGTGPDASAVDVLMNLLPALICLVALVIAWKNERIGGLLFIVLAIAYAAWTRTRLDWVMTVAGPLFLVGALFLLAGRMRKLSEGADR